MNIKTRAYLFIVCSLVGGALFPIALKVAAGNGVNIFTFMFLAFLIATPASLLLVVVRGKINRLRGYIKNPKVYLMLGIVGFLDLAFVDYGIFYAEKTISASLATVVYRIQPLLMLLFIPILLREKISKVQVVALVLGLAGVYIALSGGSLSIFSGANVGIVSFLVAVTLISAFATVLLKRYTTDMESSMFIFNSVALLVSAALFVFSGAKLPALSSGSLVSLIYIGIIADVTVPFFYFSAFRVLKTTVVTNLYFLSPFITVLFASLLLQEAIYPYYIVVAVLVTIGIAMQRFDRRGGSYVAKTKKSNTSLFDVSAAFINTENEVIHNFIKGGGRVLAITMKKEHVQHARRPRPHEKGVAYTDDDEMFVNRAQASFISEIVGKAADESVLMFAGNPDAGEIYLTEINQMSVGGEPLPL